MDRDRYIQNILCVNGRESAKKEHAWKRQAKMKEKQKDQGKGEELSEVERVFLDEGIDNAVLHWSSGRSWRANWASS